MWFDVMAVPTDAPHPNNAHAFINFLLDPAIAAENSNAIHFPNGNAQSQGALLPPLRNANILPAGELIPERAKSEAYVRLRTRMWTRFRTGQ